jgi:hypothetical protein
MRKAKNSSSIFRTCTKITFWAHVDIPAQNLKSAKLAAEEACKALVPAKFPVALKVGALDFVVGGEIYEDEVEAKITAAFSVGYREMGWCDDCQKTVAQKIVIMTCNKNKKGLVGKPHGNDNECDDEYCNRTHYSNYRDYEWDGKGDVSRFSYAHRCDECDTLNVEANGCLPPKKKKGKG